ncbi:MAG TPA: hypothetical protein VI136_04190 [Verrucomicrobiae bacterium]
MSQQTKSEVLAKLRRSYTPAGTIEKRQLLDQAVAFCGHQRQAALRALRVGVAPTARTGLALGPAQDRSPGILPPIVKPIWFSTFQPCGAQAGELFL